MKGCGDKQVGSRLPRQESQRFRLLPVVVGCFFFLLLLVFLLSSRREASIVFDTPGLKASSLRTPAAGFGRDGIPAQQGQGESGGHLQRSDDDEAAESYSSGVRGTVIAEERRDVVEGEAAPEEPERGSNAAAAAADDDATSNSDDRAERGAHEAAGQDDAVQSEAAAAITRQGALETKSPPQLEHPGDITTTRAGSVHQRRRRPLCDFSGFRADVCDFAGDIRLDAGASAFVVVDPAGGVDGPAHKVRPYVRKGDPTSMGRVTEITVRETADEQAAPRCIRTHSAPAVVFSIGGYTGNLFHDFTDVIVPLYDTAQRYRGDVQLVVTDAAPRWLAKYSALLRGLTRHAPLDLAQAAAAGDVHCFGRAVVGLRAHRELMIERGRSPDGVGMPDFTRFLRRTLSLPRDAPRRPGGGRKPRLLIVSRRGTRLLLNVDEVVRAAEEVGFETVVGELDVHNDVAQVGRLINSFDALVGVHGAGLTNMVFLPPGAAMVQIVPWGGLQWIARMDFGEPAEAMGLRYIQYEVGVGESTLKDKFPRGHEIFTNPTALHKKGFKFMRQTFLNGQDVIVDVGRFRAVLLQALNNLVQ